MWQCGNCGANLLDSTVDCPICNRPPELPDPLTAAPTAEPDHRTKVWIWLVIGVLIPPLGLLMLLMWLAHLLTPTNSSTHGK